MLEYIACNIILFKLYWRSDIIPGIIFNIIPKIKKDYTRKCKSALNTTKQIIGGVFEVADHEYDIADCPRCTWCPGWHIPSSSSGVFLHIEAKSIESSYSGVFEVADHEYDIEDCPRCTWCPGWLISASSSGVFLHIEAKSIDSSYSGVVEVADPEYDIGNCSRCTWCPG